MKRNAASIKAILFAVIALVWVIAPVRAFAADEVIHYLDKDGNTCEIAKSNVIDISNCEKAPTLEDGKTYFISQSDRATDDLIRGTIQVTGRATLILARGVRLRSGSGIHCPQGCALTITGQLDHPELASGRIEAAFQCYKNSAYIGGGTDESAGDIAICGCYVEARGGVNGAGIGGGQCGNGGKVIIRNAEVFAEGGAQGAGIGGGAAGTISDAGNGGEVLIIDSKVTAKAFTDYCGGSGIGGGGDCWCDAGDQGNGGTVTILGDSVVDAMGGDGSAIGRGDDEGTVGTVKLAEHLKVTDLSQNVGTVATAAEREGYCYYRNHVKIEPCEHAGATYATSPSAHKTMCPHCHGLSEVLEPHEFDKDGNCTTCGYHADLPYFGTTEMGEGDQDYIIFWLNVNGMDESTFKAATIEIEVWGGPHDCVQKSYPLSDWGERKGDLRSYPTWVLDDVADDALVTATVHFGDGQTVSETVELGELRATRQ